MRCEEIRDRLEEARLGLLSDREGSSLDAHLATCDACRRHDDEAGAFESILDLARDTSRDDVAVEGVLQGARRRRGRGRRVAWRLAAAAAVLAILWIGLRDRTPELQPDEHRELARGEQVTVGRAEIRAIESATLVAGRDARRVRIEDGVAHFHVRPGEGRFHVDTPAGTIEVLGTQFEVRIMRKKRLFKDRLLAGTVVVAVAVTTGLVMFGNDHGDVQASETELIVATPDGPPRKMNARTVALLLEEFDGQAERIEALESDLEDAREETAAAREAEAAAVARAAATATKPPDDPLIPAALRDTDWNKLGDAISKLLIPSEEGSLDIALSRMYLLTTMKKIASELGVDKMEDVFYHPKVMRPILDGTLRSLIPALSDHERGEVLQDVIDVVKDLGIDPTTQAASLAIEKYAQDLEMTLAVIDRARGKLEDDQAAMLMELLTADRLTGRSSTVSAGPSPDAFAQNYANMMTGRLGIDSETEKRLALEAGNLFVERHLAAQDELRAELGGLFERTIGISEEERTTERTLDERLAELKVQARLARSQAVAERALFDGATPETREKMLKAKLFTVTMILTRPK